MYKSAGRDFNIAARTPEAFLNPLAYRYTQIMEKEKQNERQNLWRFTARGKSFYASNCHSAGSGTAAGYQRIVFE